MRGVKKADHLSPHFLPWMLEQRITWWNRRAEIYEGRGCKMKGNSTSHYIHSTSELASLEIPDLIPELGFNKVNFLTDCTTCTRFRGDCDRNTKIASLSYKAFLEWLIWLCALLAVLFSGRAGFVFLAPKRCLWIMMELDESPAGNLTRGNLKSTSAERWLPVDISCQFLKCYI